MHRSQIWICFSVGTVFDAGLYYKDYDPRQPRYHELASDFISYFPHQGSSQWTVLTSTWASMLNTMPGGCASSYPHSGYSDYSSIPCCLELVMVTDPRIFEQFSLDASSTIAACPYNDSYDHTTCELTCEKNEVLLNSSDQFFYGGSTPQPGDDLPLNNVIDANYGTSQSNHGYDFFTIWFHELWHFMGFPHQDEVPNCYTDNNSIAHNDLPKNTRRGINSSDECWFAKLYCNDFMPPCDSKVKAEDVGDIRAVSISNFPNPFLSTTRIRYHLPHFGDAKIHVVDALGRVVDEIPIGEVSGGMDGYVEYSPKELPPGVYRAVLEQGGEVSSLSLVFK